MLQIAAEFGLPLALLLIALVGWWFGGRWRTRSTDSAQVVIWALVALLGLHAMLEWSLWVLFVSIPVAFLFALGEPALARRSFFLDSRLVLTSIGIAGLIYAPVMLADFNGVAAVGGRLYREQTSGGAASLDSMLGVFQIGTATYFKPHAERMMLSTMPVSGTMDAEDRVELVRRVLTRLPEEKVIALYISALASPAAWNRAFLMLSGYASLL